MGEVGAVKETVIVIEAIQYQKFKERIMIVREVLIFDYGGG